VQPLCNDREDLARAYREILLRSPALRAIPFDQRAAEEAARLRAGHNRAFEDSVDDYLEFFASRGEGPDKPFSGKILVRVAPEVHRQIMVETRCQRKSLNAYVAEKLR
jgi:predicted HicB family RNase H-like nuclease